MKKDSSDLENLNIENQPHDNNAPTATRDSLQITRRLFHFIMGIAVGLIYQL